jgi:hypothetical protein
MGRHASPDRKQRGFTIQDRRWMLHEINRLADANGIVYERDLTAWWIPRLMHGRHVKRVAKGVLQIINPLGEK